MVGVREWAGDDLLELQSEPLKVLDSFFAQYGRCVIQGCDITPSGELYNVSAGLVLLKAADPADGTSRFMVMPFAGAVNVAMPLYLTVQRTIINETYADGNNKPIAYNYSAIGVGAKPVEGTEYLTLTVGFSARFVDVIQDAAHRFMSDSERTAWNAKETTAGASDKALAALNNAKNYTDQREGIIMSDVAQRDASTLISAKAYADQIVSALVDNSPEMLNTLTELATALGNDPNFSTTVMTEIGKRVLETTFETAIEAKADQTGSYATLGAGYFAARTLDLTGLDSALYYPVAIPNNAHAIIYRSAHADGTGNPAFTAYLESVAASWGGTAQYFCAKISREYGSMQVLKKIVAQAEINNVYLWLKGGFKYSYRSTIPTALSPLTTNTSMPGGYTFGPEAADGGVPNGKYETFAKAFTYDKSSSPTVIVTKANSDKWNNQLGLLCAGCVLSGGGRGRYWTGGKTFTCVKNSTGIYTITHSLGHTNYEVMVTTKGNAKSTACVRSPNATSFLVDTCNNAGTTYDSEFFFQVFAL